MVTDLRPRPPEDDEDEEEDEENIMGVLLAWVNGDLSTFDADIYLQLIKGG